MITENRAELNEEIKVEAFDLYLWRLESYEPGSELEDWLTAERIVRARQVHEVFPPRAS